MNEKLASLIGMATRAARERTGLTQAEVAKLVDITTLFYSRLERGKLLPSLPTLMKLCRTLRASPDELLGYARPGRSAEEKESPELRRLIGLARKLNEEKLKALTAVASAMLD